MDKQIYAPTLDLENVMASFKARTIFPKYSIYISGESSPIYSEYLEKMVGNYDSPKYQEYFGKLIPRKNETFISSAHMPE